MTPAFEDRWLLVLDKPAGLPTQAARGGGDNLFDRARSGRPYVGLHHRLDTAASGLVLFTLDPAVNAAVARALREHAIERTYRAVLSGEVTSGRWDRPVDGVPARTDFTVVGARGGRAAVELSLHTGRKHQIRVHAALAGAPVLGDRRYGDEVARAFPRLALHAARLGWAHPETGAALVVESALPPELAAAWEGIVSPPRSPAR